MKTIKQNNKVFGLKPKNVFAFILFILCIPVKLPWLLILPFQRESASDDFQVIRFGNSSVSPLRGANFSASRLAQ
jgi:hypothetical protein